MTPVHQTADTSRFFDLLREQLKRALLAIPHSPALNPWMHWDVDEREEGYELTARVPIVVTMDVGEQRTYQQCMVSVSMIINKLEWRGEA